MDAITLDFSKIVFSDFILNLSLGLSSAFKIDLNVINLKKELTSEQIKNIQILKTLTSAYVEGAIPRSKEFLFSPSKPILNKTIKVELEKDQSIYKLIDILYLPLILSPNKVVLSIKGTTNKKEESIQHLKEINFRYMSLFIKKIETKIKSLGLYPQIDGEIQIIFNPPEILDKPRYFKLNYDSGLVMIRGDITATSDLINTQYSQNAIELIKMSLNQTTMINSKFYKSQTPNFLIECFGYYGINNSFDNDFPLVKGYSLIAPFDLTLSQTHFQKIILEYAKKLKENLNQKYLDDYSFKQLLPLISLFGGELVCQKFSDEYTEIINLLIDFLNVKLTQEKNKIVCEKPFFNK